MFFAAGVGAYGAAMFHLFTHAFFKALLFLGAGSVIHAMHHEQDMRFYGALRKEIPLTFWAMTDRHPRHHRSRDHPGRRAGPGFGFAGFYSKDAIIESAFASGTGVGGFAFVDRHHRRASDQLLQLAAGVPDLLRQAALGALGAYPARPPRRPSRPSRRGGCRPRHAAARGLGRIQVPAGTGGYHPHESPWTMLVPLGVLSLGAIFAGLLFHAPFIEAEEGAHFWAREASPSTPISPTPSTKCRCG